MLDAGLMDYLCDTIRGNAVTLTLPKHTIGHFCQQLLSFLVAAFLCGMRWCYFKKLFSTFATWRIFRIMFFDNVCTILYWLSLIFEWGMNISFRIDMPDEKIERQ